MALPALAASSVTCGATSNPTAPAISRSSSSRLQSATQVSTLGPGAFASAPAVTATGPVGSSPSPRPRSTVSRDLAGQDKLELTEGLLVREEKLQEREQQQLLEQTPASLGSAEVEGGNPEGCEGKESGRAEEGEPAVKRKKSRDMAVLRAEGAGPAVLISAADAKSSEKGDNPASRGECHQAHQEDQEVTELNDTQQQLQGQHTVQGTLAALKGYFLSTSGKIVFAVGGFGGRPLSTAPTAASTGSHLQSALLTGSPGGTPRPSRGGHRASAFAQEPLGASHPAIARAFPGSRTWWSDSSEEVAAAAGMASQGAAGITAEPRAGSTGAAAGEGGNQAAAGSLAGAGPRNAAGGSASGSSEFVNEALVRWERRRAEWRSGTRRPTPDGDNTRGEAGRSSRGTEQSTGRESGRVRRSKDTAEPPMPKIRPGTTYEDLLSSSRPFPEPIPLPEMVEFLVDIWREEGLYD